LDADYRIIETPTQYQFKKASIFLKAGKHQGLVVSNHVWPRWLWLLIKSCFSFLPRLMNSIHLHRTGSQCLL